MSDTTAQIAAKGCNSTGITEELAKRLHDNLGKKVVAVVELVAAGRAEKLDGSEKVSLAILTIEPAPNSATEDHLRDLARAFHYERKLAEDGPQLLEPGDGPEPTVRDVLARGTTIVGTDPDGEARLLTDADLEAAEAQLALEEADEDSEPDGELDDEASDDGEVDPTRLHLASPFTTPDGPAA